VGLPLAARDDDVELAVPAGSNVCRAAGVGVSRRSLDPAEVALRHGVRVTTAELTAVDLARSGTLEDAVVLVDRFVTERLTNLPLVRELAATASGRGCRQVRQAAALADGLAASPQETRLRLLLHRAQRPPCRAPPRASEWWGQGGPSIRLARGEGRRRVRGGLARGVPAAGRR
jgi:hypothetical protein